MKLECVDVCLEVKDSSGRASGLNVHCGTIIFDGSVTRVGVLETDATAEREGSEENLLRSKLEDLSARTEPDFCEKIPETIQEAIVCGSSVTYVFC